MNEIRFHKSGVFYEIFDDDAKIIHYLFGYRIIDGRVAFPMNAVNKVLNTLSDNCINYNIILNDEVIKDDYKDKNNYMKFLVKSNDKLKATSVMNQIVKKLNTFDEGQLYNVLNKLNEVVNEQ